VRINGTVTGHQFQPSLAANQDGELRVVYYSTQNSMTNRKIDVYEVSSIDDGAHWSSPDRVTDVSFDRPVTGPNFHPGVANVGDQAEAGDRFGAAVAVANFGGAGTRSDLAVGIPGEELGTGVFDSGAVQVFYGTDAGLGTDNQQTFDQDFPPDVDGARESGDLFGSSLAAGQLSTGQADLAIGVPGEDAGSIVDSGAVNVIYGGTGGLQLTSPADQLWDQNLPNVEGADEAHDLFGSALTISGGGTPWLAIGVPGEAVGTVQRDGAVNVLYVGSSGLQTTSPADQIWDQDSTGVPDTAEAGDLFGAAVG